MLQVTLYLGLVVVVRVFTLLWMWPWSSHWSSALTVWSGSFCEDSCINQFQVFDLWFAGNSEVKFWLQIMCSNDRFRLDCFCRIKYTDISSTSQNWVNFGTESTFLHARMCLCMCVCYKVVEDVITALEELLQLTLEQHGVRGVDPCTVENLV